MIRMREDRHTHAHTLPIYRWTGILVLLLILFIIVTNFFLFIYLCHTLILFIEVSLHCFCL